jgi:hypothetical protein
LRKVLSSAFLPSRRFGRSTKTITCAVLIFERGSGGHVGFAIGQDDAQFLVLRGSQSDTVITTRIAKSRLLGARWPAADFPRPNNLPTMKAGRIPHHHQ